MRVNNVKRWDERIARARRLAAEYPTAADLLSFYASLAEYQKSLIEKQGERGSDPLYTMAKMGTAPFFDTLDLEPVLAAIPDFLSWLQRAAPAPLKKAAAEMRGVEPSAWRDLIDLYLSDDGQEFDASPVASGFSRTDARGTLASPSAPGFESSVRSGVSRPLEDLKPVAAFVVEAVLQPFAEQSAIRERSEPRPSTSSGRPEPADGGIPDPKFRLPNPESRIPSSSACRCPSCGSLPVVGVLREEGHGAKRTLVCGLCLTERDYLRVVCPACGEQRFDALPVYTADQFEHVRIDACDSCRTYLKTIDLTKNGLAVPLVDDIASVTMDLWARDGGYARLRPNLLRM